MRIKASEVSILPFYSSAEERQAVWCPHYIPDRIFPSWATVKFMLCFGSTNPNLTGISVYDENGNNVPDSFVDSSVSEDTDSNGVTQYYLRINGITWTTAPSGNRFYIRLAIAGGATLIYSEDFFICAAKYRVDYWMDCNNTNFGNFDSSWKNSMYLKDFMPRRTENDEEVEDRENGYGITKNIFTSIAPRYKGEIYGSDSMYHHVNYIKYFDNVQLINIDTGETWDISQMTADGGSDGCAYNMPISFLRGKSQILICGASAYENAPYDDPDTPPTLDCTGFGVTISEAAGILSYTIANNPDVGLSIKQTWYRDGQAVGTGSTIALTDFGVYTVQVQIGSCRASDNYQYLNGCTMTTQLTVNGDTINGATSNAPAAVTYQVYNSAGTLVSSALPYSTGVDGLFTVKTTSGSCEILSQVQINTNGGVTDCSFTFDLTKDGSDVLTVSNVSEAVYSVQWIKIINGNQEISVGTGDTYAITESGLYIARVTALSCTKDSLYVLIQPVVAQQSGLLGKTYQSFKNYTGSDLDITNFDLPNPHIWDESEMNARIKVVVNGVTWEYKDTTAAIDEFTINISNTQNKITPHVAFAGDDIQVYRTY